MDSQDQNQLPLEQTPFAIIDTEGTYLWPIFSIGVVIVDPLDYKPLKDGYWIITPACKKRGIYAKKLVVDERTNVEPTSRKETIKQLKALLNEYGVKCIFAFGASFDCGHLEELDSYKWFDIQYLVANKNHNTLLPEEAEADSKGMLKTGNGVEALYRLLSGKEEYLEVHNGLYDSYDELGLMQMAKIPYSLYLEHGEFDKMGAMISNLRKRKKETRVFKKAPKRAKPQVEKGPSIPLYKAASRLNLTFEKTMFLVKTKVLKSYHQENGYPTVDLASLEEYLDKRGARRFFLCLCLEVILLFILALLLFALLRG